MTGYACLIAGVVGCVLPIIPGIPLLFVGLGLLSVDSPWAARLRDWLKDYIAKRLSRRRSKSLGSSY
ncbi:PGPGW domain-containing protein [Alloacidobacterium dinghuense]|nr:PGPGW domain-containing protein [Alloacidobacterium dinghuense]